MLTSNSSIVLLDRTLTASQARVNGQVKRILIGVIREAIVKPYQEYFYLVDFGPDVHPQFHVVSHDLFCACVLEEECAASVAVKFYLQRGGEPACVPNPGYFPAAPHYCPVCGARACYYPCLSSHHRGIGWQCSKYGASHYWQHQGTLPRAVYQDKPVY